MPSAKMAIGEWRDCIAISGSELAVSSWVRSTVRANRPDYSEGYLRHPMESENTFNIKDLVAGREGLEMVVELIFLTLGNV